MSPPSRVTGFVLPVLAIILATGAGCARPRPLATDEELIALFRAHRADIDSLRENALANLRNGPLTFDPALDRQQARIARRLDIQGGGPLEDSTRIFVQTQGRPLPRGLVDTKGFVWLESYPPPGTACDTLPDLDSLDDAALRTPARHFRRLEGNWWLYRAISARAED